MEKSKLLQDVLTRTPRYGGYVKILKDLPPETQPRRQLIDSKMMCSMPKTSENWKLDSDAREMLANLMACVVQMAANKTTPSVKQLEMAEKFLKFVQSDSPDELPNIAGILKYMSALRITQKLPNQIGDYTYAYKHNNDMYCALGNKIPYNNINNFDQKKKSRKFTRVNCASELGLTQRNFFNH